jgi:hypothetical protein
VPEQAENHRKIGKAPRNQHRKEAFRVLHPGAGEFLMPR